MPNKLKIYACSGVGDSSSQQGYWLDDTKTYSNTQAVNNLLSMVNLNLSKLNSLQMDSEARVELYNGLDLLVVALRLAQRYQSEERLTVAGNVLGYYVESGAFSLSSQDDKERAQHLDDTYGVVVQDIDQNCTYTVGDDWLLWWQMNVVELNHVGLTPEQQTAVEKAVSGVGAISGDLNTYLNQSQDYFLYLFIPASEVGSWPKAIQQKRKKQQEIYDYCLKTYTAINGTEQSMQNIIRSSIIDTFGLTPEAVLRRIKAGKATEPINGVGEPITLTATAIATIVSAVISAVVAIITVILQCVANVAVAKYAVPEDATSAIPETSDFDNFDGIESNNSKLLIIGAAILGFVLFAKKRKRK